MDMVRSEGLKYAYHRVVEENGENREEVVEALKGVDIDVARGAFVAILGQNGSGKSTFAKQVNALLQPTGGALWVNGWDTREEAFVYDNRQNAGMVFQNPDNQMVATIVEEDVAFGPENLGVPAPEIRRRVDEALAAVGMTDFARSQPNRLSGGQKQRVAIAGILAMKPTCIVLDEPTAMLDPRGRREVMDTILRLNREEGITILLITHYMDEAAQADYVYVVDNGQVAMEGKPREIFAQGERIRELRLDLPQVTEVAQRLRQEGFDLRPDCITVEEMVEELCRLQSNM